MGPLEDTSIQQKKKTKLKIINEGGRSPIARPNHPTDESEKKRIVNHGISTIRTTILGQFTANINIVVRLFNFFFFSFRLAFFFCVSHFSFILNVLCL